MVHKAYRFLLCLLVRDEMVGKILCHGGQKAGRGSNYILIMIGMILCIAFLIGSYLHCLGIKFLWLPVCRPVFFSVTKTKHYCLVKQMYLSQHNFHS